jgi:hypothetical protein
MARYCEDCTGAGRHLLLQLGSGHGLGSPEHVIHLLLVELSESGHAIVLPGQS